MSTIFYDVIVAKEYEGRLNGFPAKRTAWNRVGRAWTSKSGDSMSFELYLIPNQRYVIQLKERSMNEETKEETKTENVSA